MDTPPIHPLRPVSRAPGSKPLLTNAKLPALRPAAHPRTLVMAAEQHPKVVQGRLGHGSIQLTLDACSRVPAALEN